MTHDSKVITSREEREARFLNDFRSGKFINLTTGFQNPFEIERWWNEALHTHHAELDAAIGQENILTVGYHKGEMDFGVNASISELTYEQMTEFRAMCMVAIGQAESMWRTAREKSPGMQAAQSLLRNT